MASSETDELYVFQRAERNSLFPNEESTPCREAYLGALMNSRPTFDSNLQEVDWYNGPHGFHTYERLVLLSTGSISHGSECSSCGTCILGFKWSCKDPSCNGTFHICTRCYIGDKHDKNHKFARIDLPGDDEVLVGTRDSAEKLEIHGFKDNDDDIREIIPELETGRVYLDHLPKLEKFKDDLNWFTPVPPVDENPTRREVEKKQAKEDSLKKTELMLKKIKIKLQNCTISHQCIKKIKQLGNSAEHKASLEERRAGSDDDNTTKGGQEIGVKKILSLSEPPYYIKEAEISLAQSLDFNKITKETTTRYDVFVEEKEICNPDRAPCQLDLAPVKKFPDSKDFAATVSLS